MPEQPPTPDEGLTRAQTWARRMQDTADEGTVQHALGTTFGWLCEHVDEFEAGEVAAGDLPCFSDEIQAVLIYTVTFGTLWELSHPTLYAVLGPDDRLVGLFGHEPNAEARAADDPDWRVQRMSIADGDKPPEQILSASEGVDAE